MAKKTTSKKAAPAKAKVTKPAAANAKATAAAASMKEKPARTEKAPKEDLVVFAFRLSQAERDQIHKASGPAGASRFVRSLAVAAASGDEAGVKAIIKGLPGVTSA